MNIVSKPPLQQLRITDLLQSEKNQHLKDGIIQCNHSYKPACIHE